MPAGVPNTPGFPAAYITNAVVPPYASAAAPIVKLSRRPKITELPPPVTVRRDTTHALVAQSPVGPPARLHHDTLRRAGRGWEPRTHEAITVVAAPGRRVTPCRAPGVGQSPGLDSLHHWSTQRYRHRRSHEGAARLRS